MTYEPPRQSVRSVLHMTDTTRPPETYTDEHADYIAISFGQWPSQTELVGDLPVMRAQLRAALDIVEARLLAAGPPTVTALDGTTYAVDQPLTTEQVAL